MSDNKGGKTVKVRLSATQLSRLVPFYAERMAYNGLSTVLRALAFENLNNKESEHTEEVNERSLAHDSHYGDTRWKSMKRCKTCSNICRVEINECPECDGTVFDALKVDNDKMPIYEVSVFRDIDALPGNKDYEKVPEVAN